MGSRVSLVLRYEVGKEMMMVADNKYLRRARRYHIHEADAISCVVDDTLDILVCSGGVDHRAKGHATTSTRMSLRNYDCGRFWY